MQNDTCSTGNNDSSSGRLVSDHDGRRAALPEQHAIRFASRGEGLFLSSGIGLVVTGYAVFLLGVTRSLHPLGIASFS